MPARPRHEQSPSTRCWRTDCPTPQAVSVDTDHWRFGRGPPALVRVGLGSQTARMTADVLSPALLHHRTPVEFDFLRQAAFAAVSHPGGRPWRLWAVDRGVELRADGLHGLPPGGVGMQTIRIAAGMALLNMRLAVAAHGNCPVTVLLPDRSRPRVLAVLRGGAPADAAPGERALFATALAVGRQAPVVGPGPVPQAVLNGVRSAAETERAWLRSIADAGERARIAEQVPAIREYGTAGLLVVVGSNHDAPAAHLHAGQAAQRIVLTSAMLGYAAAVAAWPADLRSAGTLPPSVGGPGLFPQVLMVVGRPDSP